MRFARAARGARFFQQYIKTHLRAALVFLACCGVFLAVFALYRLPLGAVAYPALVCGLLLLLVCALDCRKAYRRHRTLAELARMADTLAEDALPEAETLNERDDLALMRALVLARRSQANAAAQQYADMADYFAVWAHQIKTPIASMRLHLQNEDSALARNLASDLARVEQYVEMAMVFLRLGEGASDYVIRECSLDDIIRQAVKRFSGEFILRKLRLVYEPVERSVLTDAKWLSFVVEQALSNALKYTREGSITIEMEEPLTLCVRDTGIGISPEDLPRVFEKGYTGFNGRADQRASGLGLYLCKRVCRNLGHTITASSTPGEGTIIRIDLSRNAIHPE